MSNINASARVATEFAALLIGLPARRLPVFVLLPLFMAFGSDEKGSRTQGSEILPFSLLPVPVNVAVPDDWS